ncbi:hypothetical protein C8Q78DRAFT_1029512 [Trametes maxima]|nr:hypothetical protein C8Q78DRAFT_1029512 [Trametes maxima]
MVSCVDCGRSGHPSCMGLDNMGDAMRSYDWQCTTCKSCSVCRRKGNEASMLICDFCDRGWHMSCFRPPFREPPEGRWHCPSCPPVGMSEPPPDQYPIPHSPEIQELPPQDPLPRPSSVASSSHHIPQSDIPDYPPTTDASEVEGDPAGPTPRRKSKLKKSRKGKEVARDVEADQDVDPSTPLPTVRRLRIRVNSPPPPVENETPTIRLRVPARGKGKAKDDGVQEENEHGLFDDILSVEDRDVRDTSIKDGDIQRFERSRLLAEVRLYAAVRGVCH